MLKGVGGPLVVPVQVETEDKKSCFTDAGPAQRMIAGKHHVPTHAQHERNPAGDLRPLLATRSEKRGGGGMMFDGGEGTWYQSAADHLVICCAKQLRRSTILVADMYW